MKISEFPKTVGRLTRRKGEMKGDEIVGVIYTLNRSMRGHKKYGPMANTQFRVLQQADSYHVMVGNRPYRVVGSPTEAAVMLASAFDSECIRAGLNDSGRHGRQEPEMSVFNNPRSRN